MPSVIEDRFTGISPEDYFKIVKIDKIYMSEALKEAKKAYERDEVPVGAIVVHGGKIIARGHNQIKMLKDPTAHAEMIAITRRTLFLNNLHPPYPTI